MVKSLATSLSRTTISENVSEEILIIAEGNGQMKNPIYFFNLNLIEVISLFELYELIKIHKKNISQEIHFGLLKLMFPACLWMVLEKTETKDKNVGFTFYI